MGRSASPGNILLYSFLVVMRVSSKIKPGEHCEEFEDDVIVITTNISISKLARSSSQ
jgi:hypothetical protein